MAPRRPRVLVVEDDLIVRFDVADSLRDAGYAVIEAESGDHGLEVLKSGIDIDLVCSDIRMPGSYDGNALAKAIKSAHPSIKIILMSGGAGMGTSPALSDGYLAKPFLMPQLLTLVADLLKTRQPQCGKKTAVLADSRSRHGARHDEVQLPPRRQSLQSA